MTEESFSPTYSAISLSPISASAEYRRPTAAFVITLVGGALIFGGGLLVLYSFLLVGTLGQYPSFVPLLGLGTGPAIIALAFVFNRRPSHSAVYGSAVIGLSIASYWSFLGGLFVGLLLGVIGGAMIIAWRPTPSAAGDRPSPSAHASSGTCPRCGRPVRPDSRSCLNCGYAFQ